MSKKDCHQSTILLGAAILLVSLTAIIVFHGLRSGFPVRVIPGKYLSIVAESDYLSKVIDLQLTPSTIDLCKHPDGRAAIRVYWHANHVDLKEVAIYVDDGVTGRRLWTLAGPTGTAVTGDWMVPGSSIIVTNALTGHLLAVHIFTTTSCEKSNIRQQPNHL